MLGFILDILSDLVSDSLRERLGRRKHTAEPVRGGDWRRDTPPSHPKLQEGGWARHYRRCGNSACPRVGWDVIETICRGCGCPTADPS
jgi:hypothetical protein